MELEAFKQKFNLPRINDYVALLSEPQKNWFWEQLTEIKQVFPDLDIYHAGSSKYGYIGFGRKRVQAKRVEDFLFVLHLEKNGEFILYITDQTYRLIPVDEDVLPQGYDKSIPEELNLRDWLNKVKKITEELDLEYSGEGLFPIDYEIEDFFTTLEAYDFLSKKYKKTKDETKKIVGFRNKSSREMALILDNSRPTFFIGVDPENNQLFKFKFKFKFVDNNSKIFGRYDEDDGRHSGLKSHAPSLDKGNKAYYIEINSLVDLEKFCEWYELDAREMLAQNELVQVLKKNEDVMNQPLNRILFGAAGTGKTFNTINHALSIIENKSLEDLGTENREDLKKHFDGYKEKGQIKFVTFHQSFSYEDFVEGIRAESDEDGSLNYLVKDGVFKEICYSVDRKIVDDELDEFIKKFKESVDESGLKLKTKKGEDFTLYINDAKQLRVEVSSGNLYSVPDDVIKGYLFRNDNKVMNGKSYGWSIANEIKRTFNLEDTEGKQGAIQPNVIIIDEINRGNISRIFGELITLIEDSKRAGAEEELSVTLPYSKQEFTVPHNVYIIGTMNSSDRSLTGLDIALRRRFTFIEMPPQPELLEGINVDGIDIKRLLTVINQRIEALLDRDHCIGHANFMHLKEQPTLNNLSDIFKQKIIPQLQEYFFDDWAKINLVLNGNGMLQSKPIEKSAIFPNVDSEELGYFEDKKAWELVPTSFDDIVSYTNIIQH